jgi:nucleotide-binding universal stress UspA family protein
MYKKLLVPVDLSEPDMAQHAIDAALTLVQSKEQQLRLLTVVPIVPVPLVEFMPVEFENHAREVSEQHLSDLGAKIPLEGGQVSTAVRVGPIYPEVLSEAEDWGADLIVIGSRRPSMLTYLLGSNAKTIVGHALCSVLIVRT